MVSLTAPGIALAAGRAAALASVPPTSAGTSAFKGWIGTENPRYHGPRDGFGCHGPWEWDGLEYDLLLASAPLNHSALWWDALPCVFAGDDQDAWQGARRAYNALP